MHNIVPELKENNMSCFASINDKVMKTKKENFPVLPLDLVVCKGFAAHRHCYTLKRQMHRCLFLIQFGVLTHHAALSGDVTCLRSDRQN